MSAFSKMVSRVGRQYRRLWQEGNSRIENKVKWLKKKFIGEERRQGNLETREEWLVSLSVGAA